MVTFVLDGTSSAQLPRRPLAVTMSVAGSSGGAELIARRDGSIDPSVVVHSPGMLIVPRVDHDVVISAVPFGSHVTFAQGTVLHVTVGLDSSREIDPDRAQLTPRDVSGLSAIELATISPSGAEQILVTTRLIRPELPLSPLAARARAAARTALGVDQLPSDRQLEVVVLVDSSLSMGPLIADGSVGASVDIAKGIAAVLSAGAPVRAVLAGQTVNEVNVDSGDTTSAFQAAIAATGLGVGVTLTEPVVSQDGAQLTIAVTDAPAQVASRGLSTQLVLSPSRAALADPNFVGAVSPPPRERETAVDRLLAEPELVDDMVRRLLAVLQVRKTW
ncbi:MAG: hypothetical protein DI630_09300 [Gordonia sp. (in: high G+C Gram-positive bacteria)]|nr:MAG: hypothetical protein DI630_09300 [Gordonia sp. (in: high G+C Gram-positive bacteria)]